MCALVRNWNEARSLTGPSCLITMVSIMEINLYATLRSLVGQKKLELAWQPDLTLRGLLTRLIESYPSLQGKILDADGSIVSHVRVFVNGRDAVFLPEGLDAQIAPGDKIDIFPPIGGGE